MPTTLGLFRTHDTPLSHQVTAPTVAPERRVANCYELLDLANEAVEGGIEDFTDGLYLDETTTYAEAQEHQANWLLDQVQCSPGMRLLDIGCGNGRLLRTANSRGAEAVGITVSRKQLARCRKQHLAAHLLDYRQLNRSQLGSFDCIVANGSVEHFVQAADAAAGRSDAIYRHMFALCRDMLDPQSSSRRMATTIIHFGAVHIDPHQMVRNTLRFPPGSDAFHYKLLVTSFGGFYPEAGQLQRCAAPQFALVNQRDGTEDYRRTSEHWLMVLQRSVWRSPRFQWGVLKKMAQHPVHTSRLMTCLLVAQSWNWQFRGSNPPMRLLRQVWQAT